MQELKNCPVCGKSDLVQSAPIEDHMVSKERFTLSTCASCSHKFTNPRIDEEHIGPYYNSPDYISHTNASKGLFAQVYQKLRNINLSRKHRLVSSYMKGGHEVLDIGCGTGAFMGYLRNKGFTVEGVEINEGARAIASQYGEVHSKLSEVQHRFNTVTMWHVLEHVYDLDVFFDELPLNSKGVLFVAVPNHESFDALHYGTYWAAWDVPIHIHHFSQASVQSMAHARGFTLERIVPMTFDSYYVSLLSEQFKRGAAQRSLSDWFNALRIGWNSNRRARKSGEYSSLIYVLRKN